MREEQTTSGRVAAALSRANEIEAASAAAIEQLRIKAGERGADGRPTAKARTARQKLASPTLSSTLASVALRDRINPALNTAIDEVERAEVAFSTAVSALRALQARKELFEEARGTPRKRAVSNEQPEQEEWKLLRELRARNVPISALDQLTEPELDFIAGLFVEKQKDFRHRNRAGAWWTLVRAGLLDVQSEAFNEDERAAILAASGEDAVRARQAYDALCELAGRQLDIPHSFARFVLAFAEESSTEDPIGAFERNVQHLEGQQWREDAIKLLDLLGLPISELQRAIRLMRSPALVSFKERQQQATEAALRREAEHRALVDLYRPAARAALAELHDAERQRERERIGANPLGLYDLNVAFQLLGADDEEQRYRNALTIRQVREGTYFTDREAERQRTVDQLAAGLAVSPEARKTVADMGIGLPEGNEPAVQSIKTPVAAQSEVASFPEPAQISTACAPLENSTGAPALSLSASELGLPDDISPEAAAAYYSIARRAAELFNEWPESTWPFAKADPKDAVAVAAMIGEFERLERDGKLNELSQRYLTLARTKSIVYANDFLIDLYARQLVAEVASGYNFEEHRKNAGFPRPSQDRW